MPTRNISREQDSFKALRVQIQAGVEALDRGEFTEIADADLDRFLRKLAARAGRTR